MNYDTPYFSLKIAQKTLHSAIFMQLHTAVVTTRELPQTFGILKRNLPRVLKTECFNSRNLPFSVEVRNTEVGHLFEHIMLTHLCQFKLARGWEEAVFNGETVWNWKCESRGSFRIYIDVGLDDAFIFSKALDKSIYLLYSIFHSASSTRDYSVYPLRFLVSQKGLLAGTGFIR